MERLSSTAKRANKPQRLSTLPATLAFNDYSDYEGAPESSDFRALPHRLLTLRLCLSDFGAGRRTPGSLGGAGRADHRKKSAGPRRTRPELLRPCLDPDRPRRPPKPPHGRTGGRICKPSRCRNGPQRATGDAIRPRKRDGDGAQRHRKATERKKNKSGWNYTRKKKMQHRATTEATRKEGRRTTAGQQNAPAGEDPTRAKRKPAGSVAPGGIELLKQGLKHGPAEDKHIDDQHSASPPSTPRKESSSSAAISAAPSCADPTGSDMRQARRYRRRSATHWRRVSKSSVLLVLIHAMLAPPINSRD